jgi:hypothetical protein
MKHKFFLNSYAIIFNLVEKQNKDLLKIIAENEGLDQKELEKLLPKKGDFIQYIKNHSSESTS